MDARWEDGLVAVMFRTSAILLDQGADVDARNRHGQTALMLAAHTGHRQAVAVLVAHRANLNTTAKYGLSALMVALVAGYVEVARLLADTGTDLSLGGTGGVGLHWQDGLRSCS
jgi:ankyrin repeat protein